MGTWDEVIQLENLRRAWRWVRSNPNAQFKAYFRELYTLYAIADDALLANLQDRMSREVYQPKQACKLFLPKPSGILRPYTLLTVEDQIAYQAVVNVVAERLFPRVRHRYNSEVFGHLYAGRTSQWFYRKWSDGYACFNAAIREAFADGYRIAASFDLTACYDSLDHGVLRHFLTELRCDPECCKVFTNWLSVWTATDAEYYHNHGIPQGPQPSGLVAEVVLQHFDSNRGRERRVRYFRYVDDIRMFAKTEHELRHMLVRLDMLSKDIGLFPQSSKIDIHEVKDIEAELKSLSNPVESVVQRTLVNQQRLRKRIVALSPKFKVSNPTRFKYLLGCAQPNSQLTNRLWRIYEKAPTYYPNIAKYLRRYKRLPRSTAKRLLNEIKRQDLYPAICSEFVQTLDGRVPRDYAAKADSFLKAMWKPATLRPTLLAALGQYLLRRDQLTFSQVKYACQHPKSWWARSQLMLCLTDQLFGRPSLAWLANRALRDSCAEVAMAAASLVLRDSMPVERPLKGIQPTAANIMKELGIIRRVRLQPCGVHLYLTHLVGAVPEVRWRVFFGANHGKVESHAIFCRACAETNITAWVNAMDVFDDWLLEALYHQDQSLGNYGGIGSVIGARRLAQKYPNIQAMAKSVHEKRYGSALSHAKEKRTGRPTHPIRFTYLRTAKRLIRAAIVELAVEWGVS